MMMLVVVVLMVLTLAAVVVQNSTKISRQKTIFFFPLELDAVLRQIFGD